jgi:hypothetical protein
MFFHPFRKIEVKKVKTPSSKDIKAKQDSVGLKPIVSTLLYLHWVR